MTRAVESDTHRFVKRPAEGGFTETRTDIAPALAALADMEAGIRGALTDMETGIRGALTDMETGIRGELAKFKADFLKWMIGGMIVQGALIVALVKLL